MNTPQLENGYTKIANELIEQYASIRVSGECIQVLWVIIRKTYGFNKKHDSIPLIQFMQATGLKKVTVCKALKKLHEMQLIGVTKKGNEFASSYCLIKNCSLWKPLPKKVTLPKKVISVTKKGNRPLPILVPSKETKTKEINTLSVSEEKELTPIQTVVNEYLNQVGLPKDKWGVVYGQHAKYAKELIAMCDGSLEKAVCAIKDASKFYKKQELTWLLSTVVKNFHIHCDKDSDIDKLFK